MNKINQSKPKESIKKTKTLKKGREENKTFGGYRWLCVWNQQEGWPATPEAPSGADCKQSYSEPNKKTQNSQSSLTKSNKFKVFDQIYETHILVLVSIVHN